MRFQLVLDEKGERWILRQMKTRGNHKQQRKSSKKQKSSEISPQYLYSMNK